MIGGIDFKNCLLTFIYIYMCIYICIYAAKLLQSYLTLCDPIDGSPRGSPVPGILQARTLEWVAISFSNTWKWKVKVKSLSHVWLSVTPWTTAHQALRPWDFPGKSTGVGCHCLLHIYILLAQTVKNLPAMQETQVWSLGWEDPLENGMATHFSILSQRIPWTEDSGGLPTVLGVPESWTQLSD